MAAPQGNNAIPPAPRLAGQTKDKGQANKGQLDAFSMDIVSLIRRYNDHLQQVLKVEDDVADDMLDDDDFTSPPEPVVKPKPPRRTSVDSQDLDSEFDTDSDEESVKAEGPEAERLSRCVDMYKVLIAGEHNKWMTANDQNLDMTIGSRKQDLEILKKSYTDPLKKVREVIKERADQHLVNFKLPPLKGGLKEREFLDKQDEQVTARMEWADSVCKAVVTDMRQEWRTGQRTLLTALAKELQTQREAAVALLKSQSAGWDHVIAEMTGVWDKEFKRTETELDRLAKAYETSMKSMYEADLNEARRHGAEQAECFKQEIKVALAREEAEKSLVSVQLRKMRWSLLKWNREYQRDIECKAAVCFGWQQAWKNDRDAEAAALEDGLDLNPESKAQEEQLEDHGYVLSRMWEVLPETEELQMDIRGFLLTLEQAVPFEGEVLRLYEDHLSHHGIVAGLVDMDLHGQKAAPQARRSSSNGRKKPSAGKSSKVQRSSVMEWSGGDS